jgi:hypothetical protein
LDFFPIFQSKSSKISLFLSRPLSLALPLVRALNKARAHKSQNKLVAEPMSFVSSYPTFIPFPILGVFFRCFRSPDFLSSGLGLGQPAAAAPAHAFLLLDITD